MKVKVPEAWRAEELREGDYLLISGLDGMVTVDFRHRSYRGGYSTTGPVIAGGTLTGRGWKQKLVDQAVQWLTEAMR